MHLRVAEGCHWPRFIAGYLRTPPPPHRVDQRSWELSVGVPVCSAAEVGEFSILPAPRNSECLPGLKRKGQGTEFQTRGLETISTPRRNDRGPESSLKRLPIFIQTRMQHCVALGPQ